MRNLLAVRQLQHLIQGAGAGLISLLASREIWADIMADVPESEKRAILVGNVAKLYKLAVPAEVVA